MNSFDIEWKSLTRVLEEYADYFIQEAKDNLGKYGAYASGKLADTMKPFIEIGQEEFKIKINLQDYWYYVENGAKGIESSPAGAKCKAHRPPVPKIKEWIELRIKLMPEEESVEYSVLEKQIHRLARSSMKYLVNIRRFFAVIS